MAAQRRHHGFPSLPRRCLVAQLAAVMALMMCAAPTTAQPQSLPLPQVPPQPTTSTPAAVPSLSVPAPCAPARATLAPCLSFLTSSNSSSPPAECCAQIRAMFQSQAPCLCAVMTSVPAASQLGGLGSALGQLLPSSCDLPADACSGATSGAPAGATTTTTPAPESGTVAAAAPGTGPAGVDPTAQAGGGGMKSVPGFVDSGAAATPAGDYRGVSAAAALISLLAAYLL